MHITARPHHSTQSLVSRSTRRLVEYVVRWRSLTQRAASSVPQLPPPPRSPTRRLTAAQAISLPYMPLALYTDEGGGALW